MGLAAAAPGSIEEDLEWLLAREDAMRSITVGFRMISAAVRREEEEETRVSAKGGRDGLRGVSVLPPSMLTASSLRARLGNTIRSPGTTLSKLAFPDRLGLGAVSDGLLMLLRPASRLGKSSMRVAPPRAASISISPCAVIGTTAASAVVGADVFAIFDRFWMLAEGVLGADAVVMEEALDDWGAVVCDSDVGMPEDDMPDVWASEAVADSKVECVAALSPLGSGDVFGGPDAVLMLFLEEAPS
jgi:hypothetical protein